MNTTQYKKKVASLGCIIKNCGQPAITHHPTFTEYAAMGKKMSDWLVIPLCHYHHLGGNYGHAIHSGKATFEKNYGSEAELLAKTIQKIVS